jgi:intracellular septation protein
VFQKTFFYTKEGWDRFTWSFAWFFVFTAVLNEVVRLTFKDTQIYNVLGFEMNGVNVWILFKIALIMPLSGVYAWFLTRLMQKYRMPAEHSHGGTPVPARRSRGGKGQALAAIPVDRSGLPQAPARSADPHRP